MRKNRKVILIYSLEVLQKQYRLEPFRTEGAKKSALVGVETL